MQNSVKWQKKKKKKEKNVAFSKRFLPLKAFQILLRVPYILFAYLGTQSV